MFFINQSSFICVFMLLTWQPLRHDAATLEARLCGFEQSCSGNFTKIVQRQDACCRSCECDDICLEKGTCCRDKKAKIYVDDALQQECLKSAYTPDGIKVSVNFPSYYTRTRCPKSYANIHIKTKCETVTPKTIKDVRPVTSQDGKIIYKNRYCSYCHDERKTLAWGVNVHKASPSTCRRKLQLETLDIVTISSNILSNCVLYFTPPTNIDFWKVLCFEESTVITHCNVTGTWSTFDSELNHLCLNQTDTGYYIFKELGQVYNNVYCSLCNSLQYDSVDNNYCMNVIGRHSSAPLYALLNIDKLFDRDFSEGKLHRCENVEILDTFFNKCRTLHCIRKSIPFQGKCVPFLYYYIGYQLVIKLVPKEPIMQTELSEPDLRRHYIYLKAKLGFEKCGLCQLFMCVEKGNTDTLLKEIYIVFVFIPTNQCKIENIWSKFLAVEKKLPLVFNLTINEKMVNFTVFRDYTPAIRLTQWEVILEEMYTKKCRPFSPRRGEMCPKVELQQHEVEHVKKNHPRAEELTWSQNKENVNDTSFVCCHEYIINQSSLNSMYDFFCFSTCIAFIIILWHLSRYIF